MPEGGGSSPPLPAIVSDPPGLAAVGSMVHPANLVPWRVRVSRFFIFSIFSSLDASGSMSILLSTTIMCCVRISPTTRHSAVCVWMPFVTSTTSIIMSIICAPPMIVRIREACPGQSTRVNCRFSCPPMPSFIWSGVGTVNAENPRSRVMPRSALCGCLSRAAVDSWVDRARTSEVFPESMCPSTPTFTFRVEADIMQKFSR
mmetsp:Transcript_25202/g.47626  ORF Transcript_25202/g.47626 Transcript_25202/m.47626 type:complete len:202 (+) Transcript_25202:1201-1806(+)